MSWILEAKNKFGKDINSMELESMAFINLLRNFNKKNNLSPSEPFNNSSLLPEGGIWLIHLKNGKDILVKLCSYEVINDKGAYVWVEFDSKRKEVFAEIRSVENGLLDRNILISSDEILEFYPS